MNRMQRRKIMKKNLYSGGTPEPKLNIPVPFPSIQNNQPDFSNVPLVTVCQSIRILINELRNRGYPIYDFDHKEKSVQSIQIIRNKVYFMAAEEVKADGKAKTGD